MEVLFPYPLKRFNVTAHTDICELKIIEVSHLSLSSSKLDQSDEICY